MSLIKEIDEFSNNKLKRKNDLEAILAAASTDKDNFESLIFNAKYVMGLQRILKQGNSADSEALQKAQRDYTLALQKTIELLDKITDYFDQKTKNYFKENYLQLSHTSLANLNELLADLEWTKMYMNNLKRKKQDD